MIVQCNSRVDDPIKINAKMNQPKQGIHLAVAELDTSYKLSLISDAVFSGCEN